MQEIMIDNKNADVTVVTLPKNVLGGNDALEFSGYIEQICNENKKAIIVNLADVELMNSSGLGMLVSALSKTKKNKIDLYLVAVPEKVNILLKMTHLDELFKTAADSEAAIECI